MTVAVYLIATVLASQNDWCGIDCFERAHPAARALGIARPFGGLDVGYSVSPAKVHRLEVGWAVPFGETLELTAGVAWSSDGHFEAVPGVRYAMFDLGGLAVPAVSVAAPLWWRQGSLELALRPAIEWRVGPAATLLGVEVDLGGRVAPQAWVGVRVSV